MMGFDAIVGNPPFAGKNTIAVANPHGYIDWLKQLHEGSHGNADLVAHFFRRAFTLLRRGGRFGLIATNTIGQGDTRATGLRWICTHGGTIYEARRRIRWPGQSAVVVSVVHVAREDAGGPFRLDGREVERITAYLFHAGGHEDPARLRANSGKSFIGSYVLGMGFTFDDTDKNGVASSVSEMRRLIENDPRNAERIFPYIGGEEVNTSPTHAFHRWVIDFGEMTEAEARRWPDLMAIVEGRVREERSRLAGQGNAIGAKRAKCWWQYGSQAATLYKTIHKLNRVLCINTKATTHHALAFLPKGMVYAHSLTIFAFETHGAFAVLQSRVHEVWTRLQGSSVKDDLTYTPTDCFEPFPFPPRFDFDHWLEQAGREYYEFRADLMVRTEEGMTKIYNRFNDPDERSPDIMHLRDLHDRMDGHVLNAYGWDDLIPNCEFILDYEEEGSESRRRKPYRYRWPDYLRDEVLARLLVMNHERAAQDG